MQKSATLEPLIFLLPPCLSRQSRNVLTLFGSEMLRPSFSALQSPGPSFAGRLSLGFANTVLTLTDGNVKHLLGKLDGITRTLRHEASMPQPPPSAPLKSKLRHYRMAER